MFSPTWNRVVSCHQTDNTYHTRHTHFHPLLNSTSTPIHNGSSELIVDDSDKEEQWSQGWTPWFERCTPPIAAFDPFTIKPPHPSCFGVLPRCSGSFVLPRCASGNISWCRSFQLLGSGKIISDGNMVCISRSTPSDHSIFLILVGVGLSVYYWRSSRLGNNAICTLRVDSDHDRTIRRSRNRFQAPCIKLLIRVSI
jgi:hypothetical protein